MTQHEDLTISQIRNFLIDGATGTPIEQEASISLAEMLAYLPISVTKLIPMTFDGVAAAGPCTATGLAIGDKVISVVGIIGELGDVASKFESTITVVDEIQQSSATDLSGNDYLAIIYRL